MNYKEIEFTLFILCLIALLIRHKYLNRYGQAELEDVLVIDNRVITISRRCIQSRHTITRIQFFNSKTGRSEGIKLLGWAHELEMTVNGILWMLPKRDYTGRPSVIQNVIGIDTSTRKVIFSAKDLKRNFNIPGKQKFSSLKVDKSNGNIRITTSQGFCHVFDCNSLSAANSSHKITPPLQQNSVCSRRIGNYSFNKISHTERYQLKYKNIPVNAAMSFIKPEFICVSPEDTKSALFVQADRINSIAKYFITTVNPEGRIRNNGMTLKNRYETQLQIISVLQTKEQALFITKNARKEKLFAVDTNSCLIKWHTSY